MISRGWPASAPEIHVRKCGCTFCQKHGGAWTSHRKAELVVKVQDPALISKYQFGTQSADFYTCSVCGVVPFVLSEINERQYAVVNVNAFDDTGRFSLSVSASDFDGEDVGSRLERRQRNWIPNVVLEYAG